MGISTNKIVRKLQNAGLFVVKTSNHMKVTHPTKPGIVIAASSPGEGRAAHNFRAQIHRTFGIDLGKE